MGLRAYLLDRSLQVAARLSEAHDSSPARTQASQGGI